MLPFPSPNAKDPSVSRPRPRRRIASACGHHFAVVLAGDVQTEELFRRQGGRQTPHQRRGHRLAGRDRTVAIVRDSKRATIAGLGRSRIARSCRGTAERHPRRALSRSEGQHACKSVNAEMSVRREGRPERATFPFINRAMPTATAQNKTRAVAASGGGRSRAGSRSRAGCAGTRPTYVAS